METTMEREQTATGRRGAVVRAAGEGERIWFANNLTIIKARAADTDGEFGLIETVAPPGFSPPRHVHAHEDETFWVLEGELTVVCGEETITAGPGAMVFLPRGVPHGYRVDGELPARFTTLITPGGMEEFFARVGRPAEGPGLPPAGPVDVEAMARWSAEFGMKLVGPPLPRP
ncbi:MAG TPA: quercetin 2,3-dioxygenase [Solirubrobacterales bacterium]|nr:quercetin 2,3-dioxygenase [Solirubrobacterales bacterium]